MPRLGLALVLAAGLSPSAFAAEAIEIAAEPLTLFADADRGAALPRLGRLSFLAGFALESPDSRFGGLSGMVVEADGSRLLAVSDSGWWIEIALAHDQAGRLSAIGQGRIAPMLDEAGQQPRRKVDADAEALTRGDHGNLMVAFEQRHRVMAFRADPDRLAGKAAPVALIPALDAGHRNRGIEALAALDSGALLAVSQGLARADGLAAWIIAGSETRELVYPFDGAFEPSDLTGLADGRLVALERAFSMFSGFRARLMLVEGVAPGQTRLTLTEIGRIEAPMLTENFEALGARLGPGGEVLFYLVSDDNHNPLQRTLLLQFALPDK